MLAPSKTHGSWARRIPQLRGCAGYWIQGQGVDNPCATEERTFELTHNSWCCPFRHCDDLGLGVRQCVGSREHMHQSNWRFIGTEMTFSIWIWRDLGK